jgi:hypothetical protein
MDEEDIPVGEMIEQADEAPQIENVEQLSDANAMEFYEMDAVELGGSEVSLSSPLPENVHSLAHLCARLGSLGKGEIEISYGESQTLEAEFFSRELSQRDYGVFAHRNPGGDFTVTAIAWSDVKRLSFRKLPDLPKRLFE